MYKMNNIVIEKLDEDHRKRIKAFFEANGVKTGGYTFLNRELYFTANHKFYGIINGMFSCYTQKEVYESDATIIKLPEPEPKNEYPKVMYVRNYGENDWVKRVVFAEGSGKYVAFNATEKLEEDYNYFDITVWNFAKDIEEPLKLTLEEIAEKFEVEKVEIVEEKI